jgi:hypothetical protein
VSQKRGEAGPRHVAQAVAGAEVVAARALMEGEAEGFRCCRNQMGLRGLQKSVSMQKRTKKKKYKERIKVQEVVEGKLRERSTCSGIVTRIQAGKRVLRIQAGIGVPL